MTLLASFALASIGVGTFVYSYTKMHPIKTRRIATDVKNMVKDFK